MYGKNNNLRASLEAFKWTGNAFNRETRKLHNKAKEVGIMEVSNGFSSFVDILQTKRTLRALKLYPVRDKR